MEDKIADKIISPANDWDFSDESNSKLKENVFLFSSMVLMKAAFKNDMETVREILKFWHEKGFTGNKEILMFFLVYIAKTQEINLDKFNEMLEEIKIDGGDIMQTLAKKIEKKGKKEGKLETARELIKRGVDINLVADVTGFPREELEKLSATVH